MKMNADIKTLALVVGGVMAAGFIVQMIEDTDIGRKIQRGLGG